jgi:hypothetical protein
MDAHFNEYLAAVAGMAEVYGDRSDDTQAIPAGTQENMPAEQLTAAV